MSNSDGTYYTSDENSIDKSTRGQCHLCGKDADIKIGIWDRYKVMTYDNEHVWRMLFLCHECNDKEKCADVESAWNYVGY
ncbi:MAG: hypothetical protein KGH81_04275 [Thaumarchaeota archaeon]|nr:hypothetical protein [Nitrososphaerota archaeon]